MAARSLGLVAGAALLLWAAGRTPREIAAVLVGSRSRVFRVVKADRAGPLTGDDSTGAQAGRARRRVLTPSRKRSVVALLKSCFVVNRKKLATLGRVQQTVVSQLFPCLAAEVT